MELDPKKITNVEEFEISGSDVGYTSTQIKSHVLQVKTNPRSMIAKLKLPLLALLALALFDAIVNGAMSAAMRADGWSALDQATNDSYQFGFALIILTTAFYLKTWPGLAALGVLLLGYWEDTLYYLLLPIVEPLTRFLSGYPNPDYLFPDRIAGWLGWIGRKLLGEPTSLDTWLVFILNAAAIAAAIVVIKQDNEKP